MNFGGGNWDNVCTSGMGGNWETSRTFCKKLGARKNVLTKKNTYTIAEDCSGNNHESKE